MKLLNFLFVIFVVELLIVLSVASAGDFDWIRGFNVKAEADPSGFRARLEARFKIGDLEMKAVLSNVAKPADAYILLRLREMTNRPTDHVIETYKAETGKGWGVLAKSLGIKPGSKEFHALKQGQDLYSDQDRGKSEVKEKGKSKRK